jgi:hypothetical protein
VIEAVLTGRRVRRKGTLRPPATELEPKGNDAMKKMNATVVTLAVAAVFALVGCGSADSGSARGTTPDALVTSYADALATSELLPGGDIHTAVTNLAATETVATLDWSAETGNVEFTTDGTTSTLLTATSLTLATTNDLAHLRWSVTPGGSVRYCAKDYGSCDVNRCGYCCTSCNGSYACIVYDGCQQ